MIGIIGKKVGMTRLFVGLGRKRRHAGNLRIGVFHIPRQPRGAILVKVIKTSSGISDCIGISSYL